MQCRERERTRDLCNAVISYQRLAYSQRTGTHPVQSAPNYEQRCALKGYAKDFQRVKAAKTHTQTRTQSERERVVERIDNNQYWMQMVLVSTKPSSSSGIHSNFNKIVKSEQFEEHGTHHSTFTVRMFNFETVRQ